jgi:hypothetical protein
MEDHHAKTAWLRKHHGIGRIETNKRKWLQMVMATTQTNNQ